MKKKDLLKYLFKIEDIKKINSIMIILNLKFHVNKYISVFKRRKKISKNQFK